MRFPSSHASTTEKVSALFPPNDAGRGLFQNQGHETQCLNIRRCARHDCAKISSNPGWQPVAFHCYDVQFLTQPECLQLNPKRRSSSRFAIEGSNRGRLVRQLRILCVMAIAAVAALALGIALKSPASRAQAPRQIALQVSGETQPMTARSTVPAVSAAGAAPTVVASNLGIRTLSVAPQT